MSSPSAHLRGTAPDSPARSFAISADGRKAAVAEGDGTIFVIPLTTGPASVSNPVQLTGNGDTHLMTFLGAGGRLAAAAGATIALWDPGQVSRLSAPPGVPVPFISHAGPPPALLSPPHGRWLELVEEVTGAWLITDGHRRQAAEQRQWPQPWELPIRRGDTPLLIGMTANNDTGVYTSLVLATAAGHIFRSWPAPSGTPVAAGMLPSGNQFAVVGSDGSVSLYDISSRKVRQLAGSAGPNVEVFPQEAAVSPDGSAAILSEWGDSSPVAGRVRYVDLRTGAAHDVGSPDVGGVLFTRHSLVIQRAAGTVQIWDLTGRRLLRTLPGTLGDTGALAVSPDGTLLARLRDDGTASLTDLATGGVLATFSLPLPGDSESNDPWSQTAILFTSDGRYLLTATSGGQLIWWSVAPPDLVRNICATVGYTLTAAQWRQYTGTNPPSTMPCTS